MFLKNFRAILDSDLSIFFFKMNFRSAAGVLVSDVKSRDVKIDSYTLSFHGRLLIEGAEIALNYGQRYGLLGENGSGKVCVTLALLFCYLNLPSSSQLFFDQLPNVILKFRLISISTSFVEKLNLLMSTPSILSLHQQKQKLLVSKLTSKSYQ